MSRQTSASFVRLTRQRTETAPVSALDRGKSRASKAPPAADSAADSPPDDAAGDAPRDPNGDPDDILLTTTLRNNVGRQNIPALKQDVRTLFELVTRSTKAHDAHRSRTEDALLNLTTMVAGIQERLNTPSLLSPSSPIPLHDVEMRVEALVQHTEVEDNRRGAQYTAILDSLSEILDDIRDVLSAVNKLGATMHRPAPLPAPNSTPTAPLAPAHLLEPVPAAALSHASSLPQGQIPNYSSLPPAYAPAQAPGPGPALTPCPAPVLLVSPALAHAPMPVPTPTYAALSAPVAMPAPSPQPASVLIPPPAPQSAPAPVTCSAVPAAGPARAPLHHPVSPPAAPQYPTAAEPAPAPHTPAYPTSWPTPVTYAPATPPASHHSGWSRTRSRSPSPSPRRGGGRFNNNSRHNNKRGRSNGFEPRNYVPAAPSPAPDAPTGPGTVRFGQVRWADDAGELRRQLYAVAGPVWEELPGVFDRIADVTRDQSHAFYIHIHMPTRFLAQTFADAWMSLRSRAAPYNEARAYVL